MAKLKSLKEASEATGIGQSTVRKYLKEFGELIPVEKGPRNALLFSSKALKALTLIKEGYQAKKSLEEIEAKLRGKSTRTKKVAKAAPVKKAAAPKAPKAAPAQKPLAQEETIMRGYEDQEATQGLW